MGTENFIMEPFVKQNYDLLKSCRICLSSNISMTPIFECKNTILDKIEFCTGILLKKEEGIPTQICINCLKNLSVAHEFKTSCLVSEEILKKNLFDKVKIEINEETDCIYSNVEFNHDIKDESLLETLDDDIKIENQEKNETSNSHEIQGITGTMRNSKQMKIQAVRKKRGPYKNKYKKTVRFKKLKYRRLFCEKCNIKFTSRQESEAHKKEHHSNNFDLICEFCGKVFPNERKMRYHMRTRHKPLEYQCAHCEYICALKYDLIKHLRIHFDIKEYKCEKCGRHFRTSSAVNEHNKRNHGGVRKQLPCSICNKIFHDNTKLNRHIDSHNHVKRYSCEICRSSYTRMAYWKKHMLKLHNIVIPPHRPGRKIINVET